MLYGTKDQIVGRLDELRENGLDVTGELDPKSSRQIDPNAANITRPIGASVDASA